MSSTNSCTKLSLEQLLDRGYDGKCKARSHINYENVPTQKYGTLQLTASFPCFLEPELYRPLDQKVIDDTVERVIDYFYTAGFNNVPRNSKKMMELKGICAYVTATFMYPCLPTEIFESELTIVSIALIVVSFDVDDMLEKDQGFGDLGSRAVVVISLIGNYLRGTATESDLPQVYPSLLPLKTAAKTAMARITELSPNYSETKEHFITALTNSLVSIAALQLIELNPQMKISKAVFKAINCKDAGAVLYLENLLNILGIRLPDEIRNLYLFHEAMNALDAMARWTNDIMSLGKDIQTNEQKSSILQKVDQGKMSMEEACAYVEKKGNQEIQNMLSTGRLLRCLYPDSEELDQFLLLYGQMIDVFGHRFSTKERYPDVSTSVSYET